MGWAPLRTVRDGSWKFIDAPQPELYDLARDSAERTNVYATEPATARALRRTLETMARAAPDRANPLRSAPMRGSGCRRSDTSARRHAGRRRRCGGSQADVPLFERLLEATGPWRGRAGPRGDDCTRGAGRGRRQRLRQAGARPRPAGRRAAPRGHRGIARPSVAAVPGSADAHHWIALAQLRLGDRAARSPRKTPRWPSTAARRRHRPARRAAVLSGRKAEGVQALRDAITAEPADVALRVSLAICWPTPAWLPKPSVLAASWRRNDVPHGSGWGCSSPAPADSNQRCGSYPRALRIDPGHDEARFERPWSMSGWDTWPRPEPATSGCARPDTTGYPWRPGAGWPVWGDRGLCDCADALSSRGERGRVQGRPPRSRACESRVPGHGTADPGKLCFSPSHVWRRAVEGPSRRSTSFLLRPFPPSGWSSRYRTGV